MSMFEMFVSYSLLVAASLSLLTYWITRKFVLKKICGKMPQIIFLSSFSTILHYQKHF